MNDNIYKKKVTNLWICMTGEDGDCPEIETLALTKGISKQKFVEKYKVSFKRYKQRTGVQCLKVNITFEEVETK